MRFDDYEDFFLLTISDLRNRLDNNTDYDTIRACGLCRQLIIDKRKPLVDLANEELKIAIMFEVAMPVSIKILKAPKGVDFTQDIVWNAIKPYENNRHIVDENKFKEIQSIKYLKHKISISEIIHAASNFMGGVHIRPYHKPEEEALFVLHEATKKDASLTMNLLKSICEVVLKAIEPLEQAILGRTPAGGFSPQS